MQTITGNVFSGIGQGSSFTALPWASQQFIEKLGIQPWPGTLNLELVNRADELLWQAIQENEPCRIISPDKHSCDASAFPVVIRGRYAGAVVRPLVPAYAANQIEIISAIGLREALDLDDGSPVDLQFLDSIKVAAMIFDLDGTLIDTIEAFYVLAARTGEEFGLRMDRKHVHELLNNGKPYWDSVLDDSVSDRQGKIDQMNSHAVQLWPQVMREHAGPFPGVYKTIAALKNKGLKLGIVTGSGNSSVDLLYSAGVEGFFDAVITGDDVDRRKPAPDGLLLCLEHLGIEASDSAYVGDTSIDMQAARAAGMTAIAVLSGAGNPASLCRDGAHRIIPGHASLADLVEATG